MKIGVLGLGYVGVVNLACFSKAGYTVYCTDVKKIKVHQVREGKSPIGEPEVDDLLARGIEAGTIIPTESPQEVVANSDVLIVCVGTPSKSDGEVNLSYLNNAVMEIASFLKADDKKYITFRSTVPPGTTETICAKYLGNDFPDVIPVFYPEFLREGVAVKDFYNYGRFVIGKSEKHNIDPLIDLLHVNKDKPTFITDLRTAEYSKYIDNGFHALKVAFANEIFGLASDLQVDVQTAYKIFIADDKLNISSYYFRPGLPFGGSCLPKDVRELQYLMKSSDREFSIMTNVIPSNEAFIQHLIERIKATQKSKVSFIGFTFKNNSDDLRESPMLKIVNEMHNDLDLRIWDEDLNSQYLRVDHPHLYSAVGPFEEVIAEAEVLVVSKRFLDRTLQNRKPHQLILNFSDSQGIKADNLENLYR
ncbi:nucleotide sugar dehydrogenase [Bacteroidia bacterium]|jgi:GDP-mannose 6-dehydrogenase|nr:nucleotide sugar dehydrogenase [Bacteroidia bacterium]